MFQSELRKRIDERVADLVAAERDLVNGRAPEIEARRDKAKEDLGLALRELDALVLTGAVMRHAAAAAEVTDVERALVLDAVFPEHCHPCHIVKTEGREEWDWKFSGEEGMDVLDDAGPRRCLRRALDYAVKATRETAARAALDVAKRLGF
jgi:hypothetical protein